MPALPNMNIVPFISVENMMDLVLNIGVETFLGELAAYTKAEFTCCHGNVSAIRQAYPW